MTTLRALVILLAVGASASAAQARPDTALAVVGTADYDCRLADLDGRPLSLEAYRGAVVVVNAWATWCTACVAELASLEALRDSVAADGVRFLFVSPEDPGPVRRFVRSYGYGDLPVVVEDERLPAAFRLEALPTTWVIDRHGRIVLQHRGAAVWDTGPMRDFLRYLATR